MHDKLAHASAPKRLFSYFAPLSNLIDLVDFAGLTSPRVRPASRRIQDGTPSENVCCTKNLLLPSGRPRTAAVWAICASRGQSAIPKLWRYPGPCLCGFTFHLSLVFTLASTNTFSVTK